MPDCRFRLISWNVASRVKRQAEQLNKLVQRESHILTLQEVTKRTARLWQKGLSRLGYKHVLTSFELADDLSYLTGGRRYGVLAASVWELEPLSPKGFSVPWPERVLSCRVRSPFGAIEIHSAHIPAGSSHGWIKIETFEGIYERLARQTKYPRILCGDFNSPKIEKKDGTVVPFGLDKPRWAQGELNVITGLAKYDLSDVYRLLNGYKKQENSWSRKIWGRQRGGRFDHIFASRVLTPIECKYLHHFRDAGLSDHSPMVACFAPKHRK